MFDKNLTKTNHLNPFKEKYFPEWNSYELLLFFLILANTIYSLSQQAIGFYHSPTYNFNWSDLFVSYEGGLVRRGLIGTLIAPMAGHSYFEPVVTLAFVLIYILWYLFVFRIFSAVIERFWVLLLMGSPAIFLVSSLGTGFFGRKDVFIQFGFCIILSIIAYSLRKGWKLYTSLSLITITYAVALLIHEIMVFFIGFLVCFLLLLAKSVKQRSKLIIYSICLIAFSYAYLYFFKGTIAQREMITNFWLQFYPKFGHAINYIGADFSQTHLSKSMIPYLKKPVFFKSCIETLLLVSVPICAMWYRYNVHKALTSLFGKLMTLFFYIQGIIVTILFFYMWHDFGRLVSVLSTIWIMSAMYILLIYKKVYGTSPEYRGYLPNLSNCLCFFTSLIYLFCWCTVAFVSISDKTFLIIQIWQKKFLIP